MSQDAALSWRYFSDIFASIGVISAPIPRYRKWVAWVGLPRGFKDFMFSAAPPGCTATVARTIMVS